MERAIKTFVPKIYEIGVNLAPPEALNMAAIQAFLDFEKDRGDGEKRFAASVIRAAILDVREHAQIIYGPLEFRVPVRYRKV